MDSPGNRFDGARGTEIDVNAMQFQLNGIHHVSALSAHIARTHQFYPKVMGLRPVIKTVNQDEPSMYHLFYGDGVGSPGSDLTVFDLPHATAERRGNNSISRTTFRIHGEESFAYWERRLHDLGVEGIAAVDGDGRSEIIFEDPEGIQLALVEDGGAGAAFPWEESPVPAEHQIRGLGFVELTVPRIEPTGRFLTEALGLRLDREYPVGDRAGSTATVYSLGEGGAHAEVHVVAREGLPRGKYGAGGVHHVALRTPGDTDMTRWVKRLEELGYHTSGVVDRHYFTSVYVREPNGVLFELATDGPGFSVDGPLDGGRLSLPPFLEERRQEIEEQLVPLTEG